MNKLGENFYSMNRDEIESFIQTSNHNNTTFLKSAHSLWIRFKNYDNNDPLVYIKDGEIISIAFISKLKKQNMINLYDIVSFAPGGGTKLWDFFIEYYYNKGVRNIKFRALHSAVPFYNKLGIYYWGFDGKSFTVEQPLFPTSEQMREWLEEFKLNPVLTNERLLENKESSKKLSEFIESLKNDLGDRYYLNVKEKQKGEDW